ncbi:MAG: hypothetical protein EXR28_11395 [Betaproteobacteria bacterium]|nr:hypothetical protein [Betaproteobacteria bacterium]
MQYRQMGDTGLRVSEIGFGCCGNAGPMALPSPIVSRLSSEIGKTLKAPEVKSKLTELSMVAITSTPGQFASMVRDTGSIYQNIIKAGNIQME